MRELWIVHTITDRNYDSLFDEDTTDRLKNVDGEPGDFLEYCVPLYPSASKTVFEYHVETYQFALKHNLTKVAYQDLLNLIPQFLPSSNLAIKSQCKLKGLFNSIWNRDNALTKHRYCSIYHIPLTEDEEECSQNCGQAIEHFVLCDIEVQLRTFVSGNVFFWQYTLCIFIAHARSKHMELFAIAFQTRWKIDRHIRWCRIQKTYGAGTISVACRKCILLFKY